MTGLEKFIDAMRKDGRSDYGTVMQLALSILSEEKAHAINHKQPKKEVFHNGPTFEEDCL